MAALTGSATGWYKEKIVTGIFPDGNELRITLCTESGYETGMHAAYLQYGREAMSEKYGDKWIDVVFDVASPLATRTEWQRIQEWARMLSCLVHVEKRSEGGEWAIIPQPAEWAGVETFTRSLPGVLYVVWANTAAELNPGLHVASTDDAKKNGVSVTVS